MWRTLRLALIWLLACALSLQGIASATMFDCDGQLHLEGSHVSEAGHAHMEGHHTQSSTAGVHQHAEGVVSHPVKPALSKLVGHKCGACAACCLGVLALLVSVQFEPITTADRFASLVDSTLAAYVSEGLERPPRRFLA